MRTDERDEIEGDWDRIAAIRLWNTLRFDASRLTDCFFVSYYEDCRRLGLKKALDRLENCVRASLAARKIGRKWGKFGH